MKPPALISGVALLAFGLAAFSFVPAGRADSWANDTNLETRSCPSSFNRARYSQDLQVKPPSSPCANYRTNCPLPTNNCNCTNDGWVVAPWKVYTVPNLTSNYLDRTSGLQQTARPYIYANLNRTSCCALCSGNNLFQLPNKTFVHYYNNGTNPYGTSPYFSNGTKVHNCAYWMHWVPPASSSSSGSNCTNDSGSVCGYCIIFPVGADPPSCNNGTSCPPSSGTSYSPSEYATVGKGCPGGTNDPHFIGAKGTHFDFNGVPDQSFCLLTDKKYQVNMKMRGYYDSRTVGASILRNGMAVRTWIKDLGILWIDATSGVKRTMRIWARDGKSQSRDEGFMGGMELDGVEIPRMRPNEAKDVNGVTITFWGYEKAGGGFFDVDVYELSIPGILTVEMKFRIAHPLLQTPEDAMTHINVKFIKVEHSEVIHGVLGQTFRDGRHSRAMDYTALSRLIGRDVAADSEAGEGFLDGHGSDYATSSVLASDCKFSSFPDSGTS